MTRLVQIVLQAVLVLTLAGCAAPEGDSDSYETVLQGGRVIDPETGLDGISNVGIRSGQIVAISEEPMYGERVLDATGLVVAPGFIDLHQHGQTEEAYALSVSDGVTSTFELESGTADVDGWYQARAGGQYINYGVSIGHISVRMVIMDDEGDFLPTGPGGSQVATAEQITEMARRMEEGLRQGAVATGFGPAYTPAATQLEIETMMRISAERGASAHIHVAGSLEGSLDGLLDAIATAETTGTALHVVHANSSGGPLTSEFLSEIAAARARGLDITTETYPYGAGLTEIGSALFDEWESESWPDERYNDLQWAETGERLTRETFFEYRQTSGIVIIHGRTEAMTRAAVTSPLTMIASDGFISNGRGHPRSSGSYARVLGKYVREDGALTLGEAIRKMTIEPARRLERRVEGMRNKGRIHVGADADITVFDPDTVADRATYTEPALPSEGIEYVIVNGVIVVDDGELVANVRPGQPIRAAQTP